MVNLNTVPGQCVHVCVSLFVCVCVFVLGSGGGCLSYSKRSLVIVLNVWRTPANPDVSC